MGGSCGHAFQVPSSTVDMPSKFISILEFAMFPHSALSVMYVGHFLIIQNDWLEVLQVE